MSLRYVVCAHNGSGNDFTHTDSDYNAVRGVGTLGRPVNSRVHLNDDDNCFDRVIRSFKGHMVSIEADNAVSLAVLKGIVIPNLS